MPTGDFLYWFVLDKNTNEKGNKYFILANILMQLSFHRIFQKSYKISILLLLKVLNWNNKIMFDVIIK